MEGLHHDPQEDGGGIAGEGDEALLELKSELATVVEALGFLHDFIESAFSAKFQSFCDDHQQQKQSPSFSREGGAKVNDDPRMALRLLRWKHYNGGGFDGGAPAGRKGQRLGSSSDFKRCSNDKEEEAASRLSMVVGQSEVVDVKYEANCEEEEVLPDFLEDVDPFYGEPGESGGGPYDFEDEPSIRISSTCELPPQTLKSEEEAEGEGGTKSNNQGQGSRYIPELIPIQGSSGSSDPLKNEENDSNSSYSSDGEWHPTSSTKGVKRKGKGKAGSSGSPKKKAPAVQKRPSFPGGSTGTSITPLLIGKTLIQPVAGTGAPRYNQQHNQNLTGEGGPFKCNQCPASYKQEESLKSHQKYKHNPSRVTCQCPLCGKSMVDKYRLQRHLRLHTGEKPFECQFCGQSFYRKDYHTKHMQRKHGLTSPHSYSASSSTSSSNSSASGGKATTGGGAARKVSSSQPPPGRPQGGISTTTSSASTGIYNRSSVSGGFRPRSGPQTTSTSTTSNLRPEITQIINITTSPSPSSLGLTPSSTSSSGTGFIDYFSNLGSTGGRIAAGEGETSPISDSSLGLTGSGLITMASLTFDDLISADL